MKSIVKPAKSGPVRARPLAAAVLGVFLLGVCAASLAAVRAELDRSTVQVDGVLTLSIESDRPRSAAGPDLTPLRKDFEVLGTSTSNETTIVNGSRSDRTRWLVRLQPLHAGSIDIPPIAVGSDRTSPLVLNVTAGSPQGASPASGHAFVEVDAAGAGKSVYVQQQIPYTVRVFYDGTVQPGELAAPSPSDAVVEQLGDEKHYSALRDGRGYNVIERHYAISPEKSGTLHIPPPRFSGTSLIAPKDPDSGDDPIASFLRNTPLANDPFFKNSLLAGMSLGNAGRPVNARGPEVTLEVRPRPAGARGVWLPAEHIALRDNWQEHPPQLKVGEPVTRTITIEAKGLAASQIPPLSIAQPANARLYPETPDNQTRTDGKTIYGISKQNVTYIPSAEGTLEVPPVDLAWWNTQTNAPSRSLLPAREYKIEPGAVPAPSNAAPAAPSPAMTPASTATPSSAPHPQRRASPGVLQQPPRALWLIAVAALLAVGVVVLAIAAFRRWRLRRTDRSGIALHPDPLPQRKAVVLRALQRACAAGDRHAAKDALLNLARIEWPHDPPRGLAALAARLDAGRVEVAALDRSLYGADRSRWDGEVLWRAVRRGWQQTRSEEPGQEDGLGALYS